MCNLFHYFEVERSFDWCIHDTIWAASWQNQQNGMCAQQRLRSAWASAQSDQSLAVRMIEETLGPQLPIEWPCHCEDTDQTGRMPRLIWVFPWRTSFCWFCHEVAHMWTKLWGQWQDFLNDPCFGSLPRNVGFTACNFQDFLKCKLIATII